MLHDGYSYPSAVAAAQEIGIRNLVTLHEEASKQDLWNCVRGPPTV